MKKSIILLMTALAIIAVPAFAQTEADFEVVLTADGEGVVIRKYIGQALQVHIPAEIEGIPVREIGHSAFRRTRITSVVIPGSVTVIDGYAFAVCTALTAITIPESVTSMGHGVFAATGLVSFTWPASVPVIPQSAFLECENLKTITIPEGVREIDDSAFRSCTALPEIRLPSTIKKIGWTVFDGCRSLVSVVIPDSVETINFNKSGIVDGFSGCPRLNLSSQAALKKRGYTGQF